ncbi:hypothetical protein [Prevotella sp. E13-27]|nr:hypothetical protein [Prevotella sp. E13-27]MCK8622061.1 hypothetical protein [Prevotella sp. E13-27]
MQRKRASETSSHDIVKQLMHRGVTAEQLRSLQKKYEKQTNGEILGAKN